MKADLLRSRRRRSRRVAAAVTVIRATPALLWFLVVGSPAFAIYALSLGAIKLDFRFDDCWPLVQIPGWSKHELTWVLPKWRPW